MYQELDVLWYMHPHVATILPEGCLRGNESLNPQAAASDGGGGGRLQGDHFSTPTHSTVHF